MKDSTREVTFFFNNNEIRNENEILRFTPNISYSTGNFSRLREEHSKLQLDSVNGTNDRYIREPFLKCLVGNTPCDPSHVVWILNSCIR